MNFIIKSAIQQGLEPVRAIRMATLNTAEYFGLKKLGAVAPGRFADLVIFDDFDSLAIKQVYKNGKLVARDGVAIYDPPLRPQVPVRGSVNIRWLEGDEFKIPATGKRARLIGIVPDQIVTEKLECTVKTQDGCVVSDVDQDIIKLFVVERHRGTGHIGKGLIKGFGLKRGAIAASIAHDSHNIIVVGVDDIDILKAVTTVNKMGGGIAIVENEKVLDVLELPIAGLMSDKPLEVVSRRMDDLKKTAHLLGVTLSDPLMTLSFMALPVIPSLKLTDLGLVDVEKFEHVELFVD